MNLRETGKEFLIELFGLRVLALLGEDRREIDHNVRHHRMIVAEESSMFGQCLSSNALSFFQLAARFENS